MEDKNPFPNAITKWWLSAFVPALLPLVSRAIYEQSSLSPELCLFIMVLATTGLTEAIYGGEPDTLRRTCFIALCGAAAYYGVTGYGSLVTGQHSFSGLSMMPWFLTALPLAYIAYKWRIIKDRLREGIPS